MPRSSFLKNPRIVSPVPNPALDPVRFAHWTLRDEAAQRRSALRWALPAGNT
jgi:hypothetical protein